MDFQQTIELIATGFEAAGVGVLVIGSIIALITFAAALIGQWRVRHAGRAEETRPMAGAYRGLRRGLGRSILLGLEFLVAADIIRSVAVAPTLQSVVVLGIIVLIRTFLSWSLEVEITGRWPWQGPRPGALARQPGDDDEGGV